MLRIGVNFFPVSHQQRKLFGNIVTGAKRQLWLFSSHAARSYFAGSSFCSCLTPGLFGKRTSQHFPIRIQKGRWLCCSVRNSRPNNSDENKAKDDDDDKKKEKGRKDEADGNWPRDDLILFGLLSFLFLPDFLRYLGVLPSEPKETSEDEPLATEPSVSPSSVSWSEFLHRMLAVGEVEEIVMHPAMNMVFVQLHDGAVINGERSKERQFVLRHPNVSGLEAQIREFERGLGIPAVDGVSISYRRADSAPWIILFILAFGAWMALRFFRKNGSPFNIKMQNPLDSFRQARFRLVDPHSGTAASGKTKIRFKDVAGLYEAKQEVSEFLGYLKRPGDFTKLGARLPKGALLLGPPGCGKTLLAKAVANESNVPFLAMNGTDFIEMIGGLGAARVRDLFKTAKARAPCIIYIDEIDAIGKKRRTGGSGFDSNTEEEQTLNQLLVEMDGIDSAQGVIILASTNRPDVLDKALLRPGRFDRHITIDLPTLLERVEIYELYLSKLVLETTPETYARRLAQLTPGFTGADISNVCNEAAIQAATNQLLHVDSKSLFSAVERINAGSRKRSAGLSPEDKELMAYHESGHALAAWLLPNTDALIKMSIVPRTSRPLGFSQYHSREKKLLNTEELMEGMCVRLGGRVAESLTRGHISTAAEDDLAQVTRLAKNQVQIYGMNQRVGPLSFVSGAGNEFMPKPYSKQFHQLIDQEVSLLVGEAYRKTETLIRQNLDKLELLAQALLEKEDLSYEDVKSLIGAPPAGEKRQVDQIDDELLPTFSEE